MSGPGPFGRPIRTRWMFEALFELRRVGRLLRRPRHEVGHRWDRPGWCDYRAALLAQPGLPKPVRERLRALPDGFLSVYSLHRESGAWLYRRILEARPSLVLEAGCGISTILTAMALEALPTGTPPGRLISLESAPEWVDLVGQVLRDLDLERWVSLHRAPLVDVTWRGRAWQSYDAAAVRGVTGVEQLLIDGPPSAVGREPVLPQLHGCLAPGCCILLDDARRSGERLAVAQWEATGLARLRGFVPAGNGFAVLEALGQ